jgi:tRNA threonylcarbamoyladenosine biosynthesis protein TsaB
MGVRRRAGLQWTFSPLCASVIVLALETSSEFCSVALWSDGAVHAREALAGQTHTERVLPMVDELLRESGCRLGNLSGIAFGAGPGSFTGLRIACGLAQGLALGANLRLLPVGTLEGLAEGAGADRVICCIDARLGEIYHGAYRREAARWRAVSPPRLCLPADAPQVPGECWTGCGSGFDAYREPLERRYGGRLASVLANRHPRAADIAALAAPRLAAGEGVDPADAAPIYIRDKVALKESER